MRLVHALVLLAAALLACSSSHAPATAPSDASTPADAAVPVDASSADAADSAALPDVGIDAAGIIAARPYTLNVPGSYDSTKPTPLLVMFHGYGYTGGGEEAYLRMSLESDSAGFLYAYGDGMVDSTGSEYWNATDACCDLYHSGVDDVAYFDAIVWDVSSKYNVDPKRIFVFGHSNGGFMAHRLACDRASTVAAIVSLAGAVYADPSKCNPTEHVPVVELHGDADMTILYGGGSTSEGTYPSATTTVATWAQKNGCTGALAPTGTTYTIDTTLPANQTVVSAYGGCPSGVDVELWTIQGGGHVPSLNRPVFFDALWGFFSAHPKP